MNINIFFIKRKKYSYLLNKKNLLKYNILFPFKKQNNNFL